MPAFLSAGFLFTSIVGLCETGYVMNHLSCLAMIIGLGAGSAADPLATSQAWSQDHAAHLLRRAGFGGTPEQIEFLTKLGRQKAVEYLVYYESVPETPIPVTIEPHQPPPRFTHPHLNREELRKIGMRRRQASRRQFQRVVRWWIETMVSSSRPLQEKLVLFWHGHLTSGYREVQSSRLMYEQNHLLRKHASGRLRELLIDVTEDPAMILYLNTQQNRKRKPNENYARELLELFTMGPGHYTEKDIKEAARAFTGLGLDKKTGRTIYRARQHDSGEKTFLGKTGNFEPADIIDIILEQSVTAEYLARKFWTFFAYEEPEERVIKALAKVLRDNDYDFKPMLTAMFTSEAFYSDRARFTHIKSPVELLVGTMRTLEIPPIDTTMMATGLRMMGQSLMQPPNVKGWDGGATWITTSTLMNRYNTIGVLLSGNDNPSTRTRRANQRRRLLETVGDEAKLAPDDMTPLQPAYDPMPIVEREKLKTVEDVVDCFVSRLLQRPIKQERRQVLIDALKRHINTRNVQSPGNAPGVRGLIHLIVSMPEYQLS
ncbi:MAG: DUF1800 domain-containing protein [Phycisphaerales bacterium]|nr:DUF1800 domain-containing protein [Phycisphaerales bacterium]